MKIVNNETENVNKIQRLPQVKVSLCIYSTRIQFSCLEKMKQPYTLTSIGIKFFKKKLDILYLYYC